LRAITDRRVSEAIERHIGNTPLEKADAYPVSSYRELVEQVARLSFLNKDYLLFYRGQGLDFRNRANASTFYPAIYRGDYVSRRDLALRFRLLDVAAEQLRYAFSSENVPGEDELRRKVHVQWSILQHYEVCRTPLLDMTHSIRVACSFAQMLSKGEYGYVSVFGLPYLTNRISHNSEHDIVNVRLLSICPPEALRPYFQEAYLSGTEDVTREYDSKSELDFNRRLIAKFRIPVESSFWGVGFARIPIDVLYPKHDRVEELCKQIKVDAIQRSSPRELGEFVLLWAVLEEAFLGMASSTQARMFTVREAIKRLSDQTIIEPDLAEQLDAVRKLRNLAVHEPKKAPQADVDKAVHTMRAALDVVAGWDAELWQADVDRTYRTMKAAIDEIATWGRERQ